MSYKTVCTLISQFLIHKNRGLREINFYYYYYYYNFSTRGKIIFYTLLNYFGYIVGIKSIFALTFHT